MTKKNVHKENLSIVQEFVDMVNKHNLLELEYEASDFKVKVVKNMKPTISTSQETDLSILNTKFIKESTNHIVCHGIPSDKILKEGDIVNVDVTALKDGWHGDSSRTFEIGEVSIKAKKLVKTTYDAMMEAIKIVKEDIYLGDIGAIIQNHVEAEGFSVVQDFCGHGIGKLFHEEPSILHYGKKGTGEKIKAGMIFTIEPMINFGKYETKTLNDGWTAVTKDKSLSAQFEHTIGVTKDGYEIFTLSKM